MGQFRLLAFGFVQEGDCSSNRDIVHLMLTQVVGGVAGSFFALLSGIEPPQMLPAPEEVFQPVVIAHDAVDDTSAGAHDLGGQ